MKTLEQILLRLMLWRRERKIGLVFDKKLSRQIDAIFLLLEDEQ